VLDRLIRFYVRYSPLARGKQRLAMIGRRLRGAALPEVVRTSDGRRLEADLSSGMCDQVYFGLDYEPGVTRVARSVVKPGDVCMDVGANFGWYTTLFATLAGPTGQVHAFEPLPAVFEWLGRNVALLESAALTRIVRAAVAAEGRASANIYLSRNAPMSHASLEAGSNDAAAIATSPVVTLDDYLKTQSIGPVDVVKVDAEGAERAVLEGAAGLFSQPAPPIWIIEMSRETSARFGYRPHDLLEWMRARAAYSFFAIEDQSGRLIDIDHFAPRDVGANVLCVPAQRADIVRGLKRRRRRPEDFSPDAYPGRFADSRRSALARSG
jgi:FkbM family methyltransferase